MSTRAVADRLGVRINTVQWHVKTKARMLELMADAVLGEIPLTDLPADPEERARELTRRYRRALLSHRDGAALVVGTYAAEPHTLRFAEALVEALLKCGPGDREAAWTAWAVIYFTLGLTQEEQAVGQRPLGDILAGAISETAYPSLHRVAGASRADVLRRAVRIRGGRDPRRPVREACRDRPAGPTVFANSATCFVCEVCMLRAWRTRTS
ncbi:TetR/AcrR family transcriptional regulator C-terminal domain-containing protein [Streptomyces sp. GLT-R25]